MFSCYGLAAKEAKQKLKSYIVHYVWFDNCTHNPSLTKSEAPREHFKISPSTMTAMRLTKILSLHENYSLD